MRSYHQLFRLPHHKSEYLSLLYGAATLRTFVFSFLSLFLPIILLSHFRTVGYNEKSSLLLVGLVFFILPLTHGLLTFFVANINAILGTKIGFLLGQLFFLVFLLLINTVGKIELIMLSFIVWGIASGFWWTSYHTFFLEVGKKQEFGKELSIMEIFGIGSSLVAPLFAGFVLYYLDNYYFYLSAFIIIGLSFFCLVLMKNVEKLNKVNIENITEQFIKKRRDFFAFVGVGGEEIIYTVVWPLFLYSILNNYLIVGGFSSLIVMIAMTAALFCGRLIDKFPKEKIEKIGSGVVVSTWVGKILFQNPTGIFVFDAIYKIFISFFYLPITVLAYDHAIHDNKSKYVVFREIGYKTGNLLGLLFFILFVFLNLPFWFVFIIAGILSLLPGLLLVK